MNKPLILVVEDDPAVARLISTTLETRNYQYHRALIIICRRLCQEQEIHVTPIEYKILYLLAKISGVC